MQDASPPKKPYHHGSLKEALVAAGIEILDARGLEALSLRAIAAHVGVSHTAPKNHFGSLKGLLTAIAAEGFARHRAFMLGGAQGGDAAATVQAGWRADAPIVVNSSRAILYASQGADFAEAARQEALKTRATLHAARG